MAANRLETAAELDLGCEQRIARFAIGSALVREAEPGPGGGRGVGHRSISLVSPWERMRSDRRRGKIRDQV